jgi:DNA-binding transcriptional MocR family regulator
VRTLAAELGISPTTVASAYRALKARGLVTTDGRRGTSVARQPPLRVRPARRIPVNARDLASGNPAPALLPPMKRAFARLATEQKLYGGPTNYAALVQLAAADFDTDGIDGDVAVVGGALDGIERVLQAQLKPGDKVVVEDPSWPRIADLLHALGLELVPVPVDRQGLDAPRLEAAARGGVSAVILTPRGQNPTGAATGEARALALRTALAQSPNLLVVEDDYVAAVAGAPYHPVHGSTRRWAVIRSLSKVLGPDLRIALMAGDPLTTSRVEGRQRLGAGWVSHILQQAAAELWLDARRRGLLDRATAVYAERRRALIEALASRGIPSTGDSGLGVWVPLSEEVAVVEALLDDGWAVSPGERYRFSAGPGIRITTTDLKPKDSEALAASLATALRASSATYAA